jgi:hypothetical protein
MKKFHTEDTPRHAVYRMTGQYDDLKEVEKKAFNPALLYLIDQFIVNTLRRFDEDPAALERRNSRKTKIAELQSQIVDLTDNDEELILDMFTLFITSPGLVNRLKEMEGNVNKAVSNEAESDHDLRQKGYRILRFDKDTLRICENLSKTKIGPLEEGEHFLIERLMKVGSKEIVVERFRFGNGMSPDFLGLVSASTAYSAASTLDKRQTARQQARKKKKGAC